MAKKKFTLVNKTQFLLPKMEFFPIDKENNVGLFFKELGGQALLEYKEFVENLVAINDGDGELQPYQAMDLMAKFVVLSACDEKGVRVFEDNDTVSLKEKDPNLLLDMANFAMPLSGLSYDAIGKVANEKLGSTS